MRSATIAAVIALLCAPLLSGCSGPAGTSGPTPFVSPSTRGDADATARALLASLVLPPDAVALTFPPAGRLSTPPTRLACTPLTIATGFWSVTGLSIAAAQSSLEHDLPHGLVLQSTGTGSFGDDAPQTEVTYAPARVHDAILVITAQRTFDGVDLRADAEVIPPGARCTDPGGPMRPAP